MAYDLETARQKQLGALLNSMEMYFKSRKATAERMPLEKNQDGTPMYSEGEIEATLKAMDEGQKETIEQYQALGGDMSLLEAKLTEIEEGNTKKKKKITLTAEDAIKEGAAGGTLEEKLKKAKKLKEPKAVTKKEEVKKEDKKETEDLGIAKKPENVEFIDELSFIPKTRKYDPSKQFDTIPLPSKGKCYKNKKKTIAVEYLNAYDENAMVSGNLLRQGLLIDTILKNKIMDEDLDALDLIDGDRDAIILWLRATGYGNEYPVSVKDPDTGKEFDAVVDLSEVKFKRFNLESDENGWFPFTLPITQDKIKFKFLTHRDKALLDEIAKMENTLVMKGEILTMAKTLDNFISQNTDITEEVENKLKDSSKMIADAVNNMDMSDAANYTDALTNRLEASIMSINGETDREYISKYIKTMPARDAWSLRNYINDNEPGVDFHFDIEKPKSLGGGSMPVFLSVNQFVFYNILK